MARSYAIGLDFGTNSVRALVVDVSNGKEVGIGVWHYRRGTHGVILSRDPNLARQHPADYVEGTERSLRLALAQARKSIHAFRPEQVVGIGVDTTGSTPLPVGRDGKPLALQKRFSRNPNAMAWLWKDHTGVQEAAEITSTAARMRPEFLSVIGGTYSSEWFFSKILRCARVDPSVFEAAYTWVEIADWIPAMLTDTESPEHMVRGICASGHKAMYNDRWGGFPDKEFLRVLDPRLERLRDTLTSRVATVREPVGRLTQEWGKRTGLPGGIPVAVGAFDAHLGAIGAGVREGTLVKIIGTSTCDIAVRSNSTPVKDTPGLCGIVDGSVLPGYYGLEAGQSAVGDIFNWFVEYVQPGDRSMTHASLAKGASKLKAGESGLLALDWNNGNRTILVDQQLTGLLIGQTLYSRPAEIYRALVEATAFGALTIINRLEEYGTAIERVVNCGGIAEKNAFVMQVYADVTGRPMYVSRSGQTCALGSAMAGAVAAGVHKDFSTAQEAMTGLKSRAFLPRAKEHEVYRKLYPLYRTLHDAFGTKDWKGNLFNVMKTLIRIREEVRA